MITQQNISYCEKFLSLRKITSSPKFRCKVGQPVRTV